MTRDHKIGLALGILLVGAVAAFFYRHEDPVRTPLPELNSATQLDEAISRQKHAPYLEPPAKSTGPAAQTLPPVAETESGGLVPDPIALETGLTSESLTRLASSTHTATTVQERIPTLSARTHIVQRGDTLSSIAAQHLGSAARFEEIFEANRDRLRDANDLRIGQELKIPGAGAIPPATATPATTLEQPSATGSPSSIPAGRFIPHSAIRGGVPRVAAPPPATTPSAANRRLSQIPPDDQVIRR